ncbi:hypothetical protein NicSoilC12_20940 [Arthrobacter sp. NicSoilC12]|nr:hypothetical protein NicSoilC12_20940 [Arthrobacter sp. NicSoilC12]
MPPTGAKGLNLALHDVKVLFEGFDSFYATGSTVLLDAYSDRALNRVWKAQQFSYWMTSMLHTPAGADDFSAPPAWRAPVRGVPPATAAPTSQRPTPAGRRPLSSGSGPGRSAYFHRQA